MLTFCMLGEIKSMFLTNRGSKTVVFNINNKPAELSEKLIKTPEANSGGSI